jgi:hypothetical protein
MSYKAQCAARVCDMFREYRESELLTAAFCPDCVRPIALFYISMLPSPHPDTPN